MYVIVLVSSMFFSANGQYAQVESQQTYLTKEACTLMANKLQEASGLKHECRLKMVAPRAA